jgi:hypothetical protein
MAAAGAHYLNRVLPDERICLSLIAHDTTLASSG